MARFNPFTFNKAIVRMPAPSVINGLRDGDHDGPDFAGIQAEHEAYIAALETAGLDVTILPARPDYPDSIFVEDPALVFPEGAIILRPGAETRRGEAAELVKDLKRHFNTILKIEVGCVDGGDILALPDKVVIGLSGRTDLVGAKSLARCLESLGYDSVLAKTPPGVLHFKTHASALGPNHILTTPQLSGVDVFEGFDVLVVPADEMGGANVLRVNDVVLIGEEYPGTNRLLRDHAFKTLSLPTSEIAKIDAGLTCMSLRWMA